MTAGNKPSHIDDANGIDFSIMIDKIVRLIYLSIVRRKNDDSYSAPPLLSLIHI